MCLSQITDQRHKKKNEEGLGKDLLKKSTYPSYRPASRGQGEENSNLRHSKKRPTPLIGGARSADEERNASSRKGKSSVEFLRKKLVGEGRRKGQKRTGRRSDDTPTTNPIVNKKYL